MSWQGCPGPLDLVSILPYIILGAVIVSLVVAVYIIWITKREANKVFQELTFNNTDKTESGQI